MKTRQARFAPTAEREERACSIFLRPLWRGGFDAPRGTLDRCRAGATNRHQVAPRVRTAVTGAPESRVKFPHPTERRRAAAKNETKLLHGFGWP